MTARGPARARAALLGCAVGDAFGETFFRRIDEQIVPLIDARVLADGRWSVTDDTMLSLALFETLRDHGEVAPRALADRMLRHYLTDPARGYGGGMHSLFNDIAAGADPLATPGTLFGGSGSYGNGAAMRVGVLGAWMAERTPADLAEQARKSARVTHTHDDAVAGAVAMALATAAFVCGMRGADLIEHVVRHTERGPLRALVEQALVLWSDDATVGQAAAELGNGSKITALDTVPFCVYVLSTVEDDDFETVMWRTVACLGDRDTTCAMVGAALGAAEMEMPRHWVERLEAPDGLFAALGFGPAKSLTPGE